MKVNKSYPIWLLRMNADDQHVVLAALWAAYRDNHQVLDQLPEGLHERGEVLAEALNKKMSKTKAGGPKKGAKS